MPSTVCGKTTVSGFNAESLIPFQRHGIQTINPNEKSRKYDYQCRDTEGHFRTTRSKNSLSPLLTDSANSFSKFAISPSPCPDLAQKLKRGCFRTLKFETETSLLAKSKPTMDIRPVVLGTMAPKSESYIYSPTHVAIMR